MEPSHVVRDGGLQLVGFAAVDEVGLKAGELEVLHQLGRGLPLYLVGDDLHVVAVVVELEVGVQLLGQVLEQRLAAHEEVHLGLAQVIQFTRPPEAPAVPKAVSPRSSTVTDAPARLR